MFEMMAGRSPFDLVGHTDNPEQNTEDYLFQGTQLSLCDAIAGVCGQKCTMASVVQ